jgi:hypothetical protein
VDVEMQAAAANSEIILIGFINEHFDVVVQNSTIRFV